MVARWAARSSSTLGRAACNRRARAEPNKVVLMRSSAISKLGATPASSGKRRRSDWQKAWMVWIFRPSGTSSTVANKRRARSQVARTGRSPVSPARSVISVFVVGDGPARKLARNPERHLGSGGAREGEAQDAFGRGAAQQQAQHAVGQHLGLSGAGRGTDPDRGRGIRRPVLGLSHRGCARGHHVSPPGTDHSLCRARWA